MHHEEVLEEGEQENHLVSSCHGSNVIKSSNRRESFRTRRTHTSACEVVPSDRAVACRILELRLTIFETCRPLNALHHSQENSSNILRFPFELDESIGLHDVAPFAVVQVDDWFRTEPYQNFSSSNHSCPFTLQLQRVSPELYIHFLCGPRAFQGNHKGFFDRQIFLVPSLTPSHILDLSFLATGIFRLSQHSAAGSRNSSQRLIHLSAPVSRNSQHSTLATDLRFRPVGIRTVSTQFQTRSTQLTIHSTHPQQELALW